MTVSAVARLHGVSPSLLFKWRQLMFQGGQVAVKADEDVVAASKARELEQRVHELGRLLGRRTMEVEILKEALVRDAFNSPFGPFVLATTSIGQEGPDFHPFCYPVYHWNLPGNPVDLEQREGRVHRFQGHASRLSLAQRQIDVVRGHASAAEDLWKTMFDAARAQTDIDTDLIPYWIYEGPVKVERRVPMLPFFREVRGLEWLERRLTVYRLAFGQPRQEDLLENLHSLWGADTTAEDLAELQIRLEP
jgi:hypothetical protein